MADSPDLEGLVRPERRAALRAEGGPIMSDLPLQDAPRSSAFDGLYGRIYNVVIQTPALRKLVFSLWGSTEPLQDLDAFVAAAARDARAASADPVLVDIPSGGGTLLALLDRLEYSGAVVEIDLAPAMLHRAVRAARRLRRRDFRVHFLRSDALDVPLEDEVADVVVSINGLHVVADHGRFLAELARITKPRGSLWLITPVDGPSLRSRVILRAARALGITPRRPPALAELRRLLENAGFRELQWHGGESITGFSCRKQ
jgi:SAM-dependent methyltransferase